MAGRLARVPENPIGQRREGLSRGVSQGSAPSPPQSTWLAEKSRLWGRGSRKRVGHLVHMIPEKTFTALPTGGASRLSVAKADREGEASAVNTMEVIEGHASDVPVARSSRRSATEIPPARHRPDLGTPRVSRSSLRRNASRGATSPTRSISKKSTTRGESQRLKPVHSTGLALPTCRPRARPSLSPTNKTPPFTGTTQLLNRESYRL